MMRRLEWQTPAWDTPHSLTYDVHEMWHEVFGVQLHSELEMFSLQKLEEK